VGRLHIAPCTLRKANNFVEMYHRHSIRTSRDGGKFAIAAVFESSVVGVAIVGNPLSATLMDGFTAEVLRVCVLPDAPRNCNSMLYGACRRIWFEMGGRKILTYTLTEESGESLRGAGWSMESVIRGHNAQTWGKRDHLRRTEQVILAKTKRRWEALNSSVTELSIQWPSSTDEPAPLFAELA